MELPETKGSSILFFELHHPLAVQQPIQTA
jgi:hypothetical protein